MSHRKTDSAPPIDPFGPSSERRYRAFQDMRKQCPVHQLDEDSLFAVSLAAVETGLKNVDHFVGSFGDSGDRAEEDSILAAIPEPRHGMIRKIFNSALAYHHASKAEPFVEQLATGLLDETLLLASKHRGQVELMGSYVRRIPSAVIAHVLGVPSKDFETFARWSDEVLARQGQDDASSSNRSLGEIHPEFAEYLDDRISERLEAEIPSEDVITRLLLTDVDGERLSRNAVRTQTMFLIIAGNETTRNLIGNVMQRFAEDETLYSRIRKDETLVAPLIEESLRVDSPVQLLARSCTRDIELDGIPVTAGQRVLFSVASANRDESTYLAAEEFQLDRPRPRDHMAFGAGPHVCPGAYLARMETRVAIETFLRRVARIELAPGHRPEPNPVFWALGPQSLHVILTPT
ncbi:cytochrome P450 [Myxococcota bacterium]|nr:cytochrome P450 [Myxococcota bacterium]